MLGAHLLVFFKTNNDNTRDLGFLQTKIDAHDLLVPCFRKQVSLTLLIQYWYSTWLVLAIGLMATQNIQSGRQVSATLKRGRTQGRSVPAVLQNTYFIRSVSPGHVSISERKSVFLQTASIHNAVGFQTGSVYFGVSVYIWRPKPKGLAVLTGFQLAPAEHSF